MHAFTIVALGAVAAWAIVFGSVFVLPGALFVAQFYGH